MLQPLPQALLEDCAGLMVTRCFYCRPCMFIFTRARLTDSGDRNKLFLERSDILEHK
jgi:hypothetical protein